MATTSFKFQEKSQPHTYARAIARRLLNPAPPEHILDGGALAREWDEQGVQEMLNLLMPEKGRVIVMAKEHDDVVLGDGIVADRKWEVERWYGTEYNVRRLGDEFIEQVSVILPLYCPLTMKLQASRPNTNPEFFLPAPNPYIPEDLSVLKVPTNAVSRAQLQ